MQQRQQLLLQQLGIVQWVAKAQATHTASMAVLWRDQYEHATQTSHTVIVSNTDVALDAQTQQKSIPTQEAQYLSDQPIVESEQRLIKESSDSSTTADTRLTTTELEIKSDNKQELIEFNSQILVHDKFVIFVDIPQDDNERRLLSNIQKACLSRQFTLYWPLQINSWKGQGLFLESYIQGFLAIHSHKKLITLGEHTLLDVLTTFSSDIAMIKMASLAQMIASPQLKRDLWQMLYPLINSIED